MSSTRRHDDQDLLGRARLLREVEAQLYQRRNVLLVGPRDVGKSALIGALDTSALLIVDPFERITTHRAWRIRRALDHGAVCIAAARTLDRAQLGHVRRIAYRFVTVRVPPLPNLLIGRLLARALVAARVPQQLVSHQWIKAAVSVTRGRPGVAFAIVKEAAAEFERTGRLPIPAVAFVQASFSEMTAGAESAPGDADTRQTSFRYKPTTDNTTPAKTIAAIQRDLLP
jgi:hypothetical protein